MLDWLKGNGWYAHTCADMCDGRVKVYELPKGNETSTSSNSLSQEAFMDVIRDLYRNGERIKAVRVYRYAHGGTLCDAYNAVKEICGVA
jgi:hypothetical protein